MAGRTADATQYLDSIGAPELFDHLIGVLLKERPRQEQLADCLIRSVREHLGFSPDVPPLVSNGSRTRGPNVARARSPLPTPMAPSPGSPVTSPRPPAPPVALAPAPAGAGSAAVPKRHSQGSALIAGAARHSLSTRRFSVTAHHLSNWVTGFRPLPNPLKVKFPRMGFVADSVAVHVNIVEDLGSSTAFKHSTMLGQESMSVAGPTENIWFEPSTVRAALVCTGGLCPGLNGIIRDVCMGLWNSYGVRTIYGIAYGFHGFDTKQYHLIELTPAVVEEIHQRGGSIIGCNRGGFDPEFIVDAMERHGINQVYTLGGDGSLWTSDVLAQLVQERGLHAVVIGIPKSIDNDVLFMDRTFGFHTAVEEGTKAITCAHVEATAVPNGVGIVKLMGRDAGFVARNATLAVGSIVDLTLIPEVPFKLEDVKSYIDHVLSVKGHAVIVVAEGAGQELMAADAGKDATGHTVYQDIGKLLKTELNGHLKASGGRTFFIDPSYMIRATPADPNDNMYCSRLGLMAAHTAMRGYNGVTVGAVHDKMVMIPTTLIAQGTRKVDPCTSQSWQRLLEITGMWECFAGQDKPAPKAPRVRGAPAMYRRGGVHFDKMRAAGKGGTGT